MAKRLTPLQPILHAIATGWGTGVISRLSRDNRNELPEQKGFSERNINLMMQLYKEYEGSILKQPVAKLEERKQLVSQIPWGHNILLMQRLEDNDIRFWYMQQIIKNGWSRDTLASMLKNNAHTRQGTLTDNFDETLPALQSYIVRQSLKDPYVFDFITLAEPFAEREFWLTHDSCDYIDWSDAEKVVFPNLKPS